MNAAGCDVSVLIVGYNSASYMQDCMAAIAPACAHHTYEVRFVNNGTDGSEAFLAEHFPQVRVLPTKGNLGFAAGNNYLADHATGRYLLLLNPDTRVYPGAIDVLLDAAAANPAYKVLGGLAVDELGEPQPRTLHELPNLAGNLRRLAGARGNFHAPSLDGELVDAEAVNGGFMLVEKAIWDGLGGMDAEFFLYTEEMDFCRRIAEAGGRLGLVPEARIFHDLGSGDMHSPVRSFYMAAGNAHYFHKHFGPLKAWACVVTQWLVALARYMRGRVSSSGQGIKQAAALEKVALRPWTWWRGFRSPGADPRKASA